MTTREIPPAQSTFIEGIVEEDAPLEDDVLLPNMTGCDCGGLKTVTVASTALAKSAAETTVVN